MDRSLSAYWRCRAICGGCGCGDCCFEKFTQLLLVHRQPATVLLGDCPPPRLGDPHPRDLDGAPVSADALPSYPTDTDSRAAHSPLGGFPFLLANRPLSSPT